MLLPVVVAEVRSVATGGLIDQGMRLGGRVSAAQTDPALLARTGEAFVSFQKEGEVEVRLF